MRVVQIWRYPVKSMGGEPLRSVDVGTGGLPFDRRYAVMDSDPDRPGKPLTARIDKRLLGYAAGVRAGVTYVRTPAGEEHRIDEDVWLDALARGIDRPVTRRVSEAPIHDDSDVLVVSAASLRTLADEYGAFVHPLRFRPNFVVDGPDLTGFLEESWAGDINVGAAVLRVAYPCERCVVTTIDPESLETDPKFLRLVVERHAGNFGVYCSVVKGGIVAVGDEWRVRQSKRASEVRV